MILARQLIENIRLIGYMGTGSLNPSLKRRTKRMRKMKWLCWCWDLEHSTHNQFEKSLILTAPPSTLVGRCAGSHTLNDFSSLRADSFVSTLILLLDEVEGGKNSRQSRDADRPRSLCRTTNERDERMFMALIYAQVYIIYIRPFNTHDHYANERIMRLWSRGAFLTLHNLDSYKTKNLLLIIRNCVAFLSNVFIYIWLLAIFLN